MFEAEYFVPMAVSMKTNLFCVETLKGSPETSLYFRPSTRNLIFVCGEVKKIISQGTEEGGKISFLTFPWLVTIHILVSKVVTL